jgi:hypothetical protein
MLEIDPIHVELLRYRKIEKAMKHGLKPSFFYDVYSQTISVYHKEIRELENKLKEYTRSCSVELCDFYAELYGLDNSTKWASIIFQELADQRIWVGKNNDGILYDQALEIAKKVPCILLDKDVKHSGDTLSGHSQTQSGVQIVLHGGDDD